MLLLSIRPEFVDKIFAGQKRVELRRRKPRLQSGDMIAVYATKPRCELVGIVRVVAVRQSTPCMLWMTVGSEAGIDRQQYDEYFAGSEAAIGIELADPVRFKRPATLQELRAVWPGFHPPQSYRYLNLDEAGLIEQLRTDPNKCDSAQPSRSAP
ncbi:MAG: ASCH domain-containing protein [Pirellulaceae bacterium]|nr:ASCH domain-containing protein [Pirellulaceae bacterium]